MILFLSKCVVYISVLSSFDGDLLSVEGRMNSEVACIITKMMLFSSLSEWSMAWILYISLFAHKTVYWFGIILDLLQ